MHVLRHFTLLALFSVFFIACQNAPEATQVVKEVPQENSPQPKATPVKQVEQASSEEVAPTPMPEEKEEAPTINTEVEKSTSTPKATVVKGQAPNPPSSKTQLKSATEEKSIPVPEAEEETPLQEEALVEAPPVVAKPDHNVWNSQLQQYVSSTGKVNYKAWKGSRAKLDAYLADLAANPPQADWSRNEKMAYWINAYNAFTVDLILKNYPLTSITKLDGGKTWDVKRIQLGNKMYSLNNIENDILRPKYKDARIHFAVNCAAKSCPPLLNKAFLPSTLNSQLETQAKKFINNSNYNSIAGNSVKVSKIFEWYAGDFGNLVEYLNKYSQTKINSDAEVNYAQYNWELNQ